MGSDGGSRLRADSHRGAGSLCTVVVALAVVLIAAACAGGSQKANVSTSSGATTTPTATDGAVTTIDVPPLTTAPTPDTQPEETAPPRQPRRIAYPAGGARGRVDPPNTPAYQLLTSQTQSGCGELLAATETWQGTLATLGAPPQWTIYLYRAAANACLSNWNAAVADFDRLAPLTGELSPRDGGCPTDVTLTDACPSCDQAVLAWLTDVMNAYKSDPGLPPVLAGTAGAPPC